MKLYSIKIKGEDFSVALAVNDSVRARGLSGLPTLGKNKGMLFAWGELVQPYMVMRDMNFDLDFLFLDKEFEIVHIASLKKDSTTGVSSPQKINYVLELPFNTAKRLNLSVDMRLVPEKSLIDLLTDGIQQFKNGGSFEMIGEKTYHLKETDIKANPNQLQILDKNGIVVANVEKGARIFSRKHTKGLIEQYKKGNVLGLSQMMVKILDIHDQQEDQYVTRHE